MADERPQKHDPADLLDWVREFYEERGRRPIKEDMRESEELCPEAYLYRWRTMANVMASAGLPAEEVQHAKQGGIRYRREELLEWVRLWLEATGDLPAMDEFEAFPDCPSTTPVRKRYDSWRDFLVDAVGEEAYHSIRDDS